MAKVTTLEPPTKTAPEPSKNGGSKAKPADPETPKFQLDARLPKIGDPSAGTNEEYLASIQQEHWKNLTCYVYRAGPVTDRQSAGKETSIDKIGAPFDYPEILKRHGSGRYKFILSYAPPNGGQWIRVRQWFETILNLDYPPRVPLGEWLDNPANKDWEWARPMLIEQDQMRAAAVAERLNPAPQQGDSVAQALEIIEKIRGKNDDNPTMAVALIQMMNSQAERAAAAADPAKQLEMAKSLKELAAPPPAVPAQDNSVMMLLMTFIKEQGENHRAELAAMRDQLKPTESKMTDKLLEAVIARFIGGDILGGASEGKPDLGVEIAKNLGGVLQTVVEKGSELAPAIIQTVQHANNVKLETARIAERQGMNATQPWAWQGTPGGNVAPPPVQQQRTTPPPVQPIQPQVIQQPQTGPMTLSLFFAKHNQMLSRMFPSIIHAFENEDGHYLYDILLEKEGENAYKAIRADGSIDMFMQLMAQLPPDMKDRFQPESKVRQFFADFLADEHPEDDDEEGEGTDPEGNTRPIGAKKVNA